MIEKKADCNSIYTIHISQKCNNASGVRSRNSDAMECYSHRNVIKRPHSVIVRLILFTRKVMNV